MISLYKILEEVDSPINGKLQVVRTLEGIRILGGGISQSGWLVRKIWDVALKKIKNENLKIKNVLILGLGGGSAAELISGYWPKARLTGVDKDPLMIELGKQYLHLGDIPKLKIVEADGVDFVSKADEDSFDLVLVDIYVGGKIPRKFQTKPFLKSVERILSSGGIACFNHLHSSVEKDSARELGKKLREIFPVITQVRPEANIIFLGFAK